MTELIILTQAESEANNGEYKPGYFVKPLKIADDFYILNRNLSEVPELVDYKDAILSQPFFVRGDGSEKDLIYQEYLTRTQAEL